MTKLLLARNTTRVPTGLQRKVTPESPLRGDPGVTKKRRPQPKIRPLVLLVAAAKRSWTSAQFTTFQNALT